METQNVALKCPQNDYELSQIAPQKKELNEEELFVAVAEQRLNQLKGRDIGQTFRQTVEQLLGEATKNKRHMQVEDAGTQALNSLVTQKQLTQTERDKVYAQSFRAAQLDDNHNALYDSIGGGSDPTKAVAVTAKAIKSAEDILRQLDSGTLVAKMPKLSASTSSQGVTKRNLTTTSNGSGGGFLFKPVSNSSGTVSVLIPAQLGKNAQSVEILDSDGKVIDKGRFTSFGDTGQAAKFSFSKPGSAYPKNITVRITLQDGSTQEVLIGDPSKRY